MEMECRNIPTKTSKGLIIEMEITPTKNIQGLKDSNPNLPWPQRSSPLLPGEQLGLPAEHLMEAKNNEGSLTMIRFLV